MLVFVEDYRGRWYPCQSRPCRSRWLERSPFAHPWSYSTTRVSGLIFYAMSLRNKLKSCVCSETTAPDILGITETWLTSGDISVDPILQQYDVALGGCALLWVPPLKRMKHVKKLGLVHCKLIPEDMALILKSKSDMPNLPEVNLCSHLVNLCKKMFCPRQSCNRNTFLGE